MGIKDKIAAFISPKEKKPAKHDNKRKADFSHMHPDKEAIEQEVNHMLSDETKPKTQPVEEFASTEIPQEPPQKAPFDDEAEEQKAQSKAAAQTAIPTPGDAPDTKSPKGNADGVAIENMSYFPDSSGPFFMGRSFNSPYSMSPEEIDRLIQQNARLQADIERYREKLNDQVRKTNELRDWEAALNQRERALTARDTQLQARAQQLREQEDQWDRQAAARRNNAIEEANRIINQARLDAETERKRILEAEADADARQLVQQKLSDYFDDNAAQEEAFRRNLNASLAETAQGHAELIGQMDRDAQSIQNTLNQTVSNALAQLLAARDEMVMGLDDWRRKLYKTQYQDFGICFANLDKQIAGMERRLAKELAAGDTGYHPELAGELKRYIKNMKALRGSFERSLSNLGIRAFYPEQGTAFNSNFHTLENLDPMTQTDDEFNDMPIATCVKPGLLRVTEAGEESLLTAVVTVDRDWQ